MWLYNLGIICTSEEEIPKNIHLCTWLECKSARGSNEIVSALFNFLDGMTEERRFKRKKYPTLSLFSDSCPGQNKNYTMILALLMYVNSPACKFKKIHFTFPVRGHSYMTPDRVFGRIEKEFRKHETILLPTEYYKVFEKHGTTKELGSKWRVYNHKMLSDTSFKKNLLPVRDSKRWMFKKKLH